MNTNQCEICGNPVFGNFKICSDECWKEKHRRYVRNYRNNQINKKALRRKSYHKYERKKRREKIKIPKRRECNAICGKFGNAKITIEQKKMLAYIRLAEMAMYGTITKEELIVKIRHVERNRTFEAYTKPKIRRSV